MTIRAGRTANGSTQNCLDEPIRMHLYELFEPLSGHARLTLNCRLRAADNHGAGLDFPGPIDHATPTCAIARSLCTAAYNIGSKIQAMGSRSRGFADIVAWARVETDEAATPESRALPFIRSHRGRNSSRSSLAWSSS